MQTDPPLPATVRAAEPAPFSSEDRLPEGAISAPLSPDRLYRPTDPSVLTFQTTAELTPIDASAGQQRALGAIKFGTRMHKSGFNLFVVGSAGSRMQDVVQSILKSSRWDRPEPTDVGARRSTPAAGSCRHGLGLVGTYVEDSRVRGLAKCA